MPNTRTVSQEIERSEISDIESLDSPSVARGRQSRHMAEMDERAKMAREYMRGGMAPYQAARNTGFCRVALMQEAIRAMEGREAEKDAPRAAQTGYGPGPATAEAVAKTPAESADDADISLPADTVAEMCEDEETETPKPIYPFLKPGEVKKEGMKMMLQTGRIRVQLFEKDGKTMFQVTDGDRGHYVMLRADRCGSCGK